MTKVYLTEKRIFYSKKYKEAETEEMKTYFEAKVDMIDEIISDMKARGYFQ